MTALLTDSATHRVALDTSADRTVLEMVRLSRVVAHADEDDLYCAWQTAKLYSTAVSRAGNRGGAALWDAIGNVLAAQYGSERPVEMRVENASDSARSPSRWARAQAAADALVEAADWSLLVILGALVAAVIVAQVLLWGGPQ